MFDTVEAGVGLHQDSDSGACSGRLTLAPASKAAAAAVGGSFCGCVHTILLSILYLVGRCVGGSIQYLAGRASSCGGC